MNPEMFTSTSDESAIFRVRTSQSRNTAPLKSAPVNRARPSYPPVLVYLLVEDGPRRALDVGCGTGKAGRLLFERGIEALGVEVDERMAAVSRRHGLTVDVAPFERWNPEGRRFPLLVSGQAWHWVDPVKGAAKAVEVLSPGGMWAAFWNQDEAGLEPPIRERIDRVYAQHCPELRHQAAVPSLRWRSTGSSGINGSNRPPTPSGSLRTAII